MKKRLEREDALRGIKREVGSIGIGEESEGERVTGERLAEKVGIEKTKKEERGWRSRERREWGYIY